MGPERAAQLLAVGCNDMGGSIMNESITRAAGAVVCTAAMSGLINLRSSFHYFGTWMPPTTWAAPS